jgi:GR25 family glycosyltransferase involved in LPS biosynthesis
MKAFVINLDYRTDRLKEFTKTFEKFTKTVEIIREPAVCINEISPDLKKRINEWNFKYLSDKKLKGVVGCCMSHLNVWEKISKMNDHYVFVFEDDCTFINENVKENFDIYFNQLQLPKDFGIIWLNGEVSDKPGKKIPINFKIMEYNDRNTTESYIITPLFAKKMIEIIKNNIGSVDEHMGQYIRKNNNLSYKVNNPFFCQINRNDTDIQI